MLEIRNKFVRLDPSNLGEGLPATAEERTKLRNVNRADIAVFAASLGGNLIAAATGDPTLLHITQVVSLGFGGLKLFGSAVTGLFSFGGSGIPSLKMGVSGLASIAGAAAGLTDPALGALVNGTLAAYSTAAAVNVSSIPLAPRGYGKA